MCRVCREKYSTSSIWSWLILKNFNQIRKITKGSVHFEIKSDVLREGELQISEDYKIESIEIEFEKFLKKQEITDKERLLKLGIEYIQRVETKDEGK